MEKDNSFLDDTPTENERQPFVRLDDSSFRGNSATLYGVPGHSDMVVRKSFVKISDTQHQKLECKYANVLDEKERKKKIIHEEAEYLRGKVLVFKKIIGDLGIRMAKTDYVIGESPTTGEPAIFGVTEKIEGENLEKIKDLDVETAEKIDTTYAKIIADFIDSFLKNKKAWYDLKSEQFVYGKTKEDEKPDIYLVDVDPTFIDWGESDESLISTTGLGKKSFFGGACLI